MNETDLLRRLARALSLDADALVAIVAAGGHTLPAEQAAALAGADGEVSDGWLGVFLEGLILTRRGPREPGSPPPVPDTRPTPNAVLKKLRIALTLHEADMLRIFAAGGLVLSPQLLGPLFRKPGTKHFRKCPPEVLDAFVAGLAAG
ncbi:MAG: hypothetical protein ACI8PZ_000091 [Myxococcota bacterium]|jgi:uncharacterized protein YehS (DUF1456 family)